MKRLPVMLLTLIATSALATEAALPPPVEARLNHRQVPPETTSIYVEDLDSGEVLVRWNESVPRNPGSTIKLLTTLVNELERTGGRYGLQTMCEGGGQANVTIIERL